MKKLNLKGVNAKSVISIVVLIVALVNTILHMFGYNTLPISNDDIENIISSIFIIGASTYTTYKNLNVSTASQVAQEITNLIKKGELLVDDVDKFIDKFKK